MILLVNANSRSAVPIADESIHCAVTSTPYYKKRSYQGTAKWEGGDPECDHTPSIKRRRERPRGKLTGGIDYMDSKDPYYGKVCGKCHARRIDAQLGHEPLHDCQAWARWEPSCGECFVCVMRECAQEIWRVLRPDGVFFLNLGDSFNGSGGAGGRYNPGGLKAGQPKYSGSRVQGLKPKDLCGIPWRTAMALQSDGWYLRNEIIWAKAEVDDWGENNGTTMPESAFDRCTTAHEQIFVLTKSEHYFWDTDGARTDTGAIMRDVWRLSRKGGNWPGDHFAPFPPSLPERCIRLGTSEKGVCPVCGAPWVRIVENIGVTAHDGKTESLYPEGSTAHRMSLRRQASRERGEEYSPKRKTIGWEPTCDHEGDPVPATVLDPFVGSGTTLMVARQLGRRGIGLDLSWKYLTGQAKVRLQMTGRAAWRKVKTKKGAEPLEALPLFSGGKG